MWLHSLKVAQLMRSAACLHTSQSQSYLNHLLICRQRNVLCSTLLQPSVKCCCYYQTNTAIQILYIWLVFSTATCFDCPQQPSSGRGHWFTKWRKTGGSRVILEKLTGSAASQKIPRIFWNPKVHQHTFLPAILTYLLHGSESLRS